MPRFLTLLMSLLLAAAALCAQAPQKPQEPAEEDETLQPKKEYVFNPLQAESELRIGNFYFKNHNYKGAAARFREATKWNSNLAEAWIRLGETQERLKDTKAAHEAYAKFLELAPADKRAEAVRKKLGK